MDRDYNEIDLYEYLMVLRKRWPTVVGILVFALTAAGAVSLLLPKVYRVKAAVMPPILGISDSRPLYAVSPEDLAALIREGTFDAEVIRKLKLKEQELRIKATVKRNGSTVILSYDTANPDLGVKVLKGLIVSISQRYDEVVSKWRETIDQQIASFKDEEVALENRLTELQQLRQKLPKALSGNPSKSESLQNMLLLGSIYDSQITEMMNRLENLRWKMINLQARRSQLRGLWVVSPPSLSPLPVKPRPLLNLSVAGVLGLFVGVLVAFLLEGVKRHREGQVS